MDYLFFSKFSEEHFDELIRIAGGRRYTEDPSVKEKNCDYVLGNSVVELKIVEEEPIEKDTKQKKLASLFRSDIKTVILNPLDLDFLGKRKYYQELGTPIKNAIKSASKQLSISARGIGASLRIAVVVNSGLTMTTPDEFSKIAVERAKNDTTGIDVLIVAGIYYYSDTQDGIVTTEFKPHHIRGSYSQGIVDKLRDAWHVVLDNYMTSQITDLQLERTKGPVTDLFFELDGIRYVKPPIQWGKQSGFFGEYGRPRIDSTGMDRCPRVALLLPMLDDVAYSYIREHLGNETILRESLAEYDDWLKRKCAEANDPLLPIVLIPISIEEIKSFPSTFDFDDINDFMQVKFREKTMNIVENSREFDSGILSLNYILMQINQIGIDKANDIAFISHNRDGLKNQSQKYIIKGERMKYEYAIMLAAAHCLSRGADCVYHYINDDFKWK